MTVFRPTLPIIAAMVCCVTTTGLAGDLDPPQATRQTGDGHKAGVREPTDREVP